MATSCEMLKRRHPWPAQEPNVPEDWHGWLRTDTHAMLYQHLNGNTRLVVECGSWLGLSTRAILLGAPKATVICCDHWKGSPDHQQNPDWTRRLGTLYETFLRNLWPWRDRVIPIRADSLDALTEICQVGLVPDVIYIDTEHTYAQVSRELAFCTEHWPSSTVVGDDYDWSEVAKAAHEHAEKTGRQLFGHGTAYSLLPNAQGRPSPARKNIVYQVLLDYPVRLEPRFGDGKPAHREIAALLSRNDEAYRTKLDALSQFSGKLASIPEEPSAVDPAEPCWNNIFFSALDAIALYGMIGSSRPSRYWEIGSGHSTKFARRAVRDRGLATRITSLDPNPRAEVDALCDHVIREPLETVDTALFDELEEGDILFLDSSHRVFMNSDVTVFFLEVLPRLKPGVVVHVHDVFLPWDYPHGWANRFYSEQYLLAAYLLAESRRLEVLLPLVYLGRHPELGEMVSRTWEQAVFQRAFSRYRQLTGGHIGTSFWLAVK